MIRPAGAAAVAVSMLLSACAGVPTLDIGARESARQTVSQVIDHIACEIAKADQKQFLDSYGYIATIQLTMKAEDAGGATPSLNFINPLRVAGTSQTTSIGGELSRTRLRTYTQTFSVVIKKIEETRACKPGKPANALAGDLGINDVISAGVGSIDDHKPIIISAPVGDSVPLGIGAFGSNIQFTLKRSINGGPTWIRTHFRGPNGGNGLFNLSRTDTDILYIAFAPARTIPATLQEKRDREAMTDAEKLAVAVAEATAEVQASVASSNLVNSMILQSLTLTPP